MRKLVLFGLLGCVFALALLLEHFVTRPGPQRSGDPDHLVAVFGGGPPREIPATPPDEPDSAPPPADSGKGGRGGRAKAATNSATDRNEAARRSDPFEIPVASAKEHVVEKGETLATIARAQLGSAQKWHDLALWNGIDDPNSLQTGARLRLSPPDGAANPKTSDADKANASKTNAGGAKLADAGADQARSAKDPKDAKGAVPAAGERTHKIAKGDTLSHIAAQYLGDASRWREIQRLNGITDPANLTEGRTLQLPQR
jgi:nucleoid-associated protein YgaU